jgi:rare lipoprotein A
LPGPARETTRIDPVAPPATIPPSASGNPPFYDVLGERYHVLEDSRGYAEQGIASWYGREFHGRRTSNGEVYDMYALTAAHKTLPLPTTARVTNLTTGKSIVVRINDRGPFKKGRLIDLSYGAARELGFVTAGTAMVEVQALSGPTTASTGEPGRVTRRMYVQVAAFGQTANAEALKRRLESQGFSNVVIRYDARSPGAPYRVRIGPVTNAAEYDAVAARTAGLGLGEPQLIVETAGRDGDSPGQTLPGS